MTRGHFCPTLSPRGVFLPVVILVANACRLGDLLGPVDPPTAVLLPSRTAPVKPPKVCLRVIRSNPLDSTRIISGTPPDTLWIVTGGTDTTLVCRAL